MQSRTNPVKARVMKGGTALGIHVTQPCPALMEILGLSGFDYVLIDMEHGPITIDVCENMIRAADNVGIPAFARVPSNQPHLILQALEVGAMGLLVPHVCTRAEAEAVVEAGRYHPKGARGMGSTRSGWYGLTAEAPDYLSSANRETMLMVLIEHIDAVENLPRMLEVEGIDCFFIGPSDLSQSLGIPRQRNHPAMQDAIGRALKLVKEAGRVAGIAAGTPEVARACLDQGFQMVTTTSPTLIADAARDWVSKARPAAEDA